MTISHPIPPHGRIHPRRRSPTADAATPSDPHVLEPHRPSRRVGGPFGSMGHVVYQGEPLYLLVRCTDVDLGPLGT